MQFRPKTNMWLHTKHAKTRSRGEAADFCNFSLAHFCLVYLINLLWFIDELVLLILLSIIIQTCVWGQQSFKLIFIFQREEIISSMSCCKSSKDHKEIKGRPQAFLPRLFEAPVNLLKNSCGWTCKKMIVQLQGKNTS